jgi:hypothetical protein
MNNISQDLSNRLLSFLAPPPQPILIGSITLDMINNSHWDVRIGLVKVGLPIIINRFYKMFKYYDSTSHMYSKAGECDDCKRVLTDLLLGVTLLDFDYRVWVVNCGNPDFYAATNLSSLLLSIPKLYGVLDEANAIVEHYTEMDSNVVTLTYMDYITRKDLEIIDETDNLECPKMYPVRRYVAKNDIKLSSQDLNLKISEKGAKSTENHFEKERLLK